eukprot:scaffold76165_cov38-Tisochrysis_lutea.AAC.2
MPLSSNDVAMREIACCGWRVMMGECALKPLTIHLQAGPSCSLSIAVRFHVELFHMRAQFRVV